jgi:hypothetical protein
MASNVIWRVKSNAMGRAILALMHRADEVDSCKAMNRMAMLDKLREGLSTEFRSDAIRIKVLKRQEKLIKSACMRLVKLGHLVSEQGKGTRMYALPKNRSYL